jgi:hypothetical protein
MMRINAQLDESVYRAMVKKELATIAIFLIAASGWAADIHDEAGTTGAAFLKIEGGSRPVGMGGAFAGLANDVNTIFWNPAGLTTVQTRELTAMQNFSIADISNQFIGYAQRVGKGVWGASLLGAFTEIERRTRPTDEPDSTVVVGGFAAGASFAYAVSPKLSIGGTARGISQQLDIEDSFGVAVDLGGVLRTLNNRFGLGLALQNLGFLNTEENLPMTLRCGIAYQIGEMFSLTNPKPARDLFAIVADVDIPILSGFPTFHIGAENWFYDVLALRVGYSVSQGENPKNGLTGGIGVRRKGKASLENLHFQFDYAFVPNEDVGDAHRISLLMRF